MSSDLQVSSVVRVDKCFAGPGPKVLLGAEHPDPYPAKHLCLCLSWSGRAGLTNICALVFAIKPLLARWLTCLKLSTCLCILQDQTNSILEQFLYNYLILYELSIFWLFLTEQMILVAIISRFRSCVAKRLCNFHIYISNFSHIQQNTFRLKVQLFRLKIIKKWKMLIFYILRTFQLFFVKSYFTELNLNDFVQPTVFWYPE